MKKLTTILCAICFMIGGISLAIHDHEVRKTNEIMASPPGQLVWNVPKRNIPLDLQLDLEKRQLNESPVKDSVNIRDSVNYIYKVKYIYKKKERENRIENAADRTTAREAGMHLAAVTPDSLPTNPAEICTLDREEQPSEGVGVSKMPSIQLTVDGNVVYSTDDNHSTEGGQ